MVTDDNKQQENKKDLPKERHRWRRKVTITTGTIQENNTRLIQIVKRYPKLDRNTTIGEEGTNPGTQKKSSYKINKSKRKRNGARELA